MLTHSGEEHEQSQGPKESGLQLTSFQPISEQEEEQPISEQQKQQFQGHQHSGSQLTCLNPVLVHEENGLCAALLSTAGICILVTHPRHVVDIAHIWSQHFPVKPSILQEHLQQQLWLLLLLRFDITFMFTLMTTVPGWLAGFKSYQADLVMTAAPATKVEGCLEYYGEGRTKGQGS